MVPKIAFEILVIFYRYTRGNIYWYASGTTPYYDTIALNALDSSIPEKNQLYYSKLKKKKLPYGTGQLTN